MYKHTLQQVTIIGEPFNPFTATPKTTRVASRTRQSILVLPFLPNSLPLPMMMMIGVLWCKASYGQRVPNKDAFHGSGVSIDTETFE